MNAAASAYTTSIELNGVPEAGAAEIITLRSDAPDVENSFREPGKYVPVRSPLGNVKVVVLPAYSISVIRIKDKGWKKVVLR